MSNDELEWNVQRRATDYFLNLADYVNCSDHALSVPSSVRGRKDITFAKSTTLLKLYYNTTSTTTSDMIIVQTNSATADKPRAQIQSPAKVALTAPLLPLPPGDVVFPLLVPFPPEPVLFPPDTTLPNTLTDPTSKYAVA